MVEILEKSPHVVFQNHLADDDLRLQRCEPCDAFVYPPRTLCPVCGGLDLAWRPISGRGTVYSATVVRQRPERGGDYGVALIDLEEGPRLMSSVRAVDPHAVRIGMAVTAYVDEEDGVKLLRFTPAAGPGA